jgi:hypothetical protein
VFHTKSHFFWIFDGEHFHGNFMIIEEDLIVECELLSLLLVVAVDETKDEGEYLSDTTNVTKHIKESYIASRVY